jgi:phospholipid-binding lipoprotein MlaA
MIRPSRYCLTRRVACGFAFGLLSGCATHQVAESEPPNPDPFEPFNRAMYKVNDFGDRYLARPVAKGYEKATPSALRVGASRFLDNLRYPITIVNDFLQGKLRQGGADVARLALNSTVGLFGLFDPATEMGLKANDEDFGQTFAVWGLPDGPYLVVPVFGPYTVSSAIGDLAGTQVSPLVQAPEGAAAWALWAWYLVDTRYRLLGIDEEVRRAFDPYVFVRDSYLQNRRYKIYDGHVPEDELIPEEDPEPEAP